MNIYSVLDSDDDEKPKVKQTKAKEAPKKPEKFEQPIERENKSQKKEHQRHGAKDYKNPEGSGNQRKRQFDRRSGTGRGKEVAKNGAGGANWGSDKLEALKGEKHIAGDADIPEENVDENAEEVVEEPAEPEPTVFTLDEYNKRKAEQQRADSEAFQEVQIREVAADFGGMKTKDKDELTDFMILGSAKAAKGKKDQRSTSKQVVLDVAFSTAPAEQQDRDRDRRSGDRDRNRGGDRAGGRGGDRPRSGRGDKPNRGRGDGRGGNPRGNRGPRVDFNDANAFPSL